MALSWQAKSGVFERQLTRRRSFLESELAREQVTLRDVLRDVGHTQHEEVWMLKLVMAEIKTELGWLNTVEREASRRAPARHRPSA